tara:strand:- start:304 stop:1728 length:1425 start_codon:yes stop_codon:yes gene_type:complete
MVKAHGQMTQTNGSPVVFTHTPSFVDNAVIHAEYTKTTSGHKVSPPASDDFSVSHDRSYRLIEGDGDIILTHNNNYNGRIYQPNIKSQNIDTVLSSSETTVSNSPVLIYSSSNPKNRLAPETTSTEVSKGNRFTLPNMRGRSLSDVDFNDNMVKLGQSINIGFRTTDLAAKVAGQGGGSVTSTQIEKNRESTTFLSYSFTDVDAISALRFISKHDGQSIRADKFGNLHYTHQNKVNRGHYLTNTMITGGIQTDNINHAPNRITVYGKKWANNMDNVVRVDNTGRQTDGMVNEVSGGIHIPTANTEVSAQRIGQRLLATAGRAENTKTVQGIIKGSKISPGDQVKFSDSSKVSENIVLETRHNLTEKTTDVVISSVLTSMEDIIQKFQEDKVNNKFSEGTDKVSQINKIHLTTSTKLNITSSYEAKVRLVSTDGFIIGSGSRGVIHGDAYKSKSKSQRERRTGINSTKYRTLGGK